MIRVPSLAFDQRAKSPDQDLVQLRDSEAGFRTVAEAIPTAILMCQGNKLVYANHAAELLGGYTREELLTMDFWNIAHPDNREWIRQQGLARQEGKEVPSRYEFKVVTKDGEVRWVDFSTSLMELDGQPAVIAAVYDITEHKQVEERIQREAARAEALARTAARFTLNSTCVLY